VSTPTRVADLEVLYAGSLQEVAAGELFPRFERLTGYRCEERGGGSREWAKQLRLGRVRADVLLSADASVNELELMRPGEEVAEWYLIFATNELVIAYSTDSPSSVQMRALAQEKDGWLRLLQAGYRIGRPDPEVDPKGYRTLFALQLAEARLGLRGLVAQVAGPARNPEQLHAAAELMPMLERGDLDVMLCYRSQAEETRVPFLALPEQINLGSPDLAEVYAAASYQCTDGTVYRGALIAYTATPIRSGRHPLAAAAFLVFLASREAAEIIERHGFRGARAVVRPQSSRHGDLTWRRPAASRAQVAVLLPSKVGSLQCRPPRSPEVGEDLWESATGRRPALGSPQQEGSQPGLSPSLPQSRAYGWTMQ